MNVACPDCGTVYRIDPAKVPSRGVRARCMRCPGIFDVQGEGAGSVGGSREAAVDHERVGGAEGGASSDAHPAGADAPDPDRAPGRDAAGAAPPRGETRSVEQASGRSGTAELPGEPAPPSPARSASQVSEGSRAPAEGAGAIGSGSRALDGPASRPTPSAGSLGPPPFGSQSPEARARRLARALVSDIVVYHPDRRDRSLRAGTLRQEFRDEIRQSWDEYASQVGPQMARETRYFQDALNEILAGGADLF